LKNAFFWSFLSSYLGIIIQFVSVVVLARILTPIEIGTYAIAGAIFSIGQMFRDMGVSTYLIRESNLTRKQIEGALFIVWTTCIILAIIFISSSSLIANFYQTDSLEIILNILAINILIIPFGTFAQSQLRKKLEFKKLGAIELLSQGAHLIIAITLAMNDFGAISLAIASLFATITTLILINIYHTNIHKYRPRFSGVKEVLPFVTRIGASNVIQSLSGQAHPIVIGKTISEEAVAMLDKGFSVISLLNQALFNAIQNVLTPYFASLKKNTEQLETSYLTILSFSSVFAWPFLFYIGYYADIIVNFLYGSQWSNAIPLVPVLCVVTSVALIGRYFNNFAINLGLEKIVLRVNLSFLILRVGVMIYFSSYGLLAIVQGFVAIAIFRASVASILLHKYGGVGIRNTFNALKTSFMVTLISMLPVILLYYGSIKLTSIFQLIILALVAIVFWLAGVFLMKHQIAHEIVTLLTRIKGKVFNSEDQ
jgi:O-antigen/teichoic acid export membrane protein